MDGHAYVLLLGSSADDAEARLQQAHAALARLGRVDRVSATVTGPSVVSGDLNRYANQALVLVSALPRSAIADALKLLDADLGRGQTASGCVIDIDLVGEYAAAGHWPWVNPAKLDHPLFRDLVGELLPLPALS